jgi:hypothetical protein
LPIGEVAKFRMHKDKFLLRVLESDSKRREYMVVSMTPRQDKGVPIESAAKTKFPFALG